MPPDALCHISHICFPPMSIIRQSMASEMKGYDILSHVISSNIVSRRVYSAPFQGVGEVMEEDELIREAEENREHAPGQMQESK
ncbi:hypothetical protein D9756_006334 [Leucocoprinus leucothites]|uniref:Uncharacterized protein n=1 Tax=Leucocoprinus leucothites TaxID=201217 RepID=A0A8H5D3T5_9AGAR|nr:hypothetical protein D9756_006334 [Leucoagaricus leucothites]